jgi:hypothetical protein
MEGARAGGMRNAPGTMSEAKAQAPTDHELSERFAALRERWDELRGRL